MAPQPGQTASVKHHHLQPHQPQTFAPAHFHQFAKTISRSSNVHQQVYPRANRAHQLQLYDAPQMSLTLRANGRERAMLPQLLAGPQPPMLPPPPLGLAMANFAPHQLQQRPQHQIYQEPAAHASLARAAPNLAGLIERQARLNKPLCRCRVMYLGSAVPHITKNGLHGIQEPLKHLYPREQFKPNPLGPGESGKGNPLAAENTIDISHLSSSLGIDSWLSVWSNGLLVENFDEFGREIKRFFSIESLHYCAAVRFFDTGSLATGPPPGPPDCAAAAGPAASANLNSANHADCAELQQHQQDASGASSKSSLQPSCKRAVARFLPLDAPIFQCPGMLDANHPPVFAAIMRRTSGVKVLECHAFICRRDAAANALVRCCTHAYADFLSAKRLSAELSGGLQSTSGHYYAHHDGSPSVAALKRRSASLGRARSTGRQANGARLAAAGQYQVVEAVVNHHHQHHLSSGSGSGGGGGKGISSSGVSNETDNSLEISSEDNYAIIPRPAEQQQPRQEWELPDDRSVQQKARPGAERRRAGHQRTARQTAADRLQQRKVKGSSKSLFDDFMPRLAASGGDANRTHDQADARRGAAGLARAEKMSHSLDYLQAPAPACCRDDLHLNGARRNSKTTSEATDVHYSMVRSKRHSKSMQNLDGPFEFSASMNNNSSREPSIRSRSRSRRAASKQGLSRRLCKPMGCQLAPASLAGGDKARKASSFQDMSLALRDDSYRDSVSSTEPIDAANQGEPSLGAAREPHEANNSLGHQQQQIYETCAGNSFGRKSLADLRENLNPDELGALRAAAQVRPTSSKSKSLKSSRVKQRRHLNPEQHYDRPPSQSRLSSLAAGGYAAAPLVDHLGRPLLYAHSSSNNNNNNLHLQHQAPLQSYYQQLAAGPHAHHPLANSLYHQPAPVHPPSAMYLHPYSLAPAPPLPPVAYHSQHPIYRGAGQQPTIYSAAGGHYLNPYLQPPPIHHHHHQANGAGKSSFATNGSATIATSGRNKSGQSKASSLATRFRCLSPPVNFLSGGSKHKQTDQQANKNGSRRNSEISTCNQASQQVAQQQAPEVAAAGAAGPVSCLADLGGGQTAANNQLAHEQADVQQANLSTRADSIISDTQSETLTTSNIVSAQPGFKSSAQPAPSSKQKKPSWIKRLSLTRSQGGGSMGRGAGISGQPNGNPDTMSIGGSISSRGSQNALASLSVDPCGSSSGNNPADASGVSGGSRPVSIESPSPSDTLSQQQQTQAKIEKHQKRRSIFSGALTLGRSSSKQRN